LQKSQYRQILITHVMSLVSFIPPRPSLSGKNLRRWSPREAQGHRPNPQGTCLPRRMLKRISRWKYRWIMSSGRLPRPSRRRGSEGILGNAPNLIQGSRVFVGYPVPDALDPLPHLGQVVAPVAALERFPCEPIWEDGVPGEVAKPADGVVWGAELEQKG